MLKNQAIRRGKAFTLIEGVIALLILVILFSMVYTNYLSVSSSAQTNLGKAALHQVYIAESDIAGNYNQYTPDPADLSRGAISGLNVVSGVATQKNQVSIAVSSNDYLGLATVGPSGTCLGEYALSTAQGGGETPVTMPANKPCDGADALPFGQGAILPNSIK